MAADSSVSWPLIDRPSRVALYGDLAVLSTAADAGSDVTYVLAVQLCRLLVILALTPLLARWLSGRRG